MRPEDWLTFSVAPICLAVPWKVPVPRWPDHLVGRELVSVVVPTRRAEVIAIMKQRDLDEETRVVFK
jgi:hypothetical protein